MLYHRFFCNIGILRQNPSLTAQRRPQGQEWPLGPQWPLGPRWPCGLFSLAASMASFVLQPQWP